MIPEIAHWIWLAETLPPWAAANIDSFRCLHPEWTVRVWYELPEKFPFDLRVLFQQLPWYSSRSDIFRYWLLAHYGGVYLDTDIVALRNFDSLLHHEFFLAPCQPTGHIQPHLACGLMGSIPGSRSALRILESCRKRAEMPEPPRRITYGPDLLTSLFAEDRRGLTVLPLHYFYAIPDRDTTHAYDAANQLKYGQAVAGRTTYVYDATGNQRIEQPATGNRTTTTWNYENQPTQYLLPTGSPVTMSYNGDNRRVVSQQGATSTKFVWDATTDAYLSELDGSNAVQAVYTNEPQHYGSVVSQRRSSTSHWIHADALGTTRLLTSSTQTTSDAYLCDAWGNPISSSGSTVNPFRWVGGVDIIRMLALGLCMSERGCFSRL